MFNRYIAMFSIVCVCMFSLPSFAAISYSPDFDITAADKAFKLSDNIVTISMSRPAKPMKPFDITLKFEKPNVSKIYFAANMVAMNMGRFLKVMQPDKTNFASTPMVLPKCSSGNTLWYGKLDVVYNSGNIETMYFFFDLK